MAERMSGALAICMSSIESRANPTCTLPRSDIAATSRLGSKVPVNGIPGNVGFSTQVTGKQTERDRRDGACSVLR